MRVAIKKANEQSESRMRRRCVGDEKRQVVISKWLMHEDAKRTRWNVLTSNNIKHKHTSTWTLYVAWASCIGCAFWTALRLKSVYRHRMTNYITLEVVAISPFHLNIPNIWLYAIQIYSRPFLIYGNACVRWLRATGSATKAKSEQIDMFFQNEPIHPSNSRQM